MILPSRGGRVAAFEVMTGSAAVQSAIRENKSAALKTLIQTGARDGMTSLESSLAKLVAGGSVSADDALRCAIDAAELARLLEGARPRR